MTTILPGRQGEVTSDSLFDLASLYDGLRHDFGQARAAFEEARRHQQAKDTPAHRAAVLQCRAHIDALLDIYLDLRVEWPHR